MSGVVVVGSLNADLTLYTECLPRPGETVTGTGFAVHPGGKSANQAVAAARLGAAVRLVGAVGDDAHGAMLMASAEEAGVDTSGIRKLAGVPTGIAGIMVDARGENSIVIVPGANGSLSPDDVAEASAAFDGAAAVCLCLEVAQPTVLAAARAGRTAGAAVILNLSPYADIPRELVESVDILLVNAHEAAQLLGLDALDTAGQDWAALAERFARAGFGSVIVTLGSEGAVVLDASGGASPAVVRVAATPVAAVDTTGAGDAFTGALAARLAAGDGLADAARYASVAAALATTRHGTQAAYAGARDVEAMRARAGARP
ncbi:ribokinase [Sinomonas susongensis]|uniref:ribokinase n=1 Tax=Sinomonas susongensis TaxID=1324851 RepID=UPI001109CB4C|nr:ribokinase [Sinomonas susongensis]